MEENARLWTAKIAPDGTHQVVLKQRRSVVICLLIFAAIASLFAVFCLFVFVRDRSLSIGGMFSLLFCGLFCGVALLGASREARCQNRLTLSANSLVTETNLLNLYPQRRNYADGHLKLEVSQGGDGGYQVLLSLRHDEGNTILYVAQKAVDLPSSVQQVRDFGAYISQVTGWPLEVPREWL